MAKRHILFPIFLFLALFAGSFSAAAQNNFPNAPVVTGRLFNPVGNVSTNGPLALEITLPSGWHTYWRNPGVAGAPPQLNWQGSTNFVSGEILWPVPKRFSLEGLQTFGYDGTFILPLTVTLADKTKPTHLKLAADLVICTEICVPAHFGTSLNPAGTSATQDDIRNWQAAMQRLPIPYLDAGIKIEQLSLTGDTITLVASSKSGWQQPDVIIETPNDAEFGKPDVSIKDQAATFTFKLNNAPDAKQLNNATAKLTFVDTTISADGDATITVTSAPAAPVEEPPAPSLLYILAIALLGGLILNLMPCVLPVLSLKLLSVVQHAGETQSQIRRNFFASAAGILVSFWLIAGALLIVKETGMALGWGIQFQHPLFLTFLLAVVLAFTANMWGWYEITAPGQLQNKLGGPSFDKVPSAGHEFITGMLATLLATPCTAPFVGTSIGFALASSATNIIAIFTALGLGLALPYLLIASFPALAQRLPRPGRWMLILRVILGFALLATAGWLLSILYIQLGTTAILILAAIGIVLLGLLWQRHFLLAVLIGAALTLLPLILQPAPPAQQVEDNTIQWQAFEPAKIPDLVTQGKTVLVDITASWCLTCHANEKLVISTDQVQAALNNPDIYLMRGDWTQPNSEIAAFLMQHKRAGIPFNLIIGPGAPQGIVLPELLTTSALLEALETAHGN